ncbi:hypothetical protein [Thauera sp. SDU_THAU2]|uniref:hypothetical protein n=1 Tax=Thauera sp. SDU_THAU2 TaxID=3136633 RepID=UPI004054F8A0
MLKWPLADASVKDWLADPARVALLSSTARPDEIDPVEFDAIYFIGGHAVMWDFPGCGALQRITCASEWACSTIDSPYKPKAGLRRSLAFVRYWSTNTLRSDGVISYLSY